MAINGKDYSMRISVVIPLFNGKTFIERTLQSVLEQTFNDFEIVIVNDGSTDEGDIVAENFLKATNFSNYKMIHSVNKGHAFAANLGAQKATGEFLAFLDADDCFEKEKLKKMYLEINQNPQLDVIFSRFRFIDLNDNLLSRQNLNQVFSSEKFWIQLIEKGNLVYGSNSGVLVRRSKFLKQNGYDESLIACEDWDLWIRLAFDGEFGFINEDLTRIRVHSNNQSKNKTLMLKYQLQVVEKHLSLISDHKLSKKNIALMLLEQLGKSLGSFYFSKQSSMERAQFQKILSLSPYSMKLLLPLGFFLGKVGINKFLGKIFK